MLLICISDCDILRLSTLHVHQTGIINKLNSYYY